MANCADPLLNDTCTVLLVRSNADHGTFVFADSGNGPNCPHVVSRLGLSVHSECQSKFCKSSLFFPHGVNGISIPYHDNFTFAGDFAYDYWMLSTQNSLGLILGTGNAGVGGIPEISVNRAGGKLVFYEGGAIRLTSTTSVVDGCWHHNLICRSGTQLMLFIDGLLEDDLDPYNTVLNGTHFRLGVSHANTVPYCGFLAEFRVSKGVCRWDAPFTPPLYPYSYVCEPPAAKLLGTVKEKGSPVQRTVNAYLRSTGHLYHSVVSNPDGTFLLDAPDVDTDMFVIAFDDVAGTQYNSLIFDRVRGVPV